MSTPANSRKIAIALAFTGALPPISPFLTWAHKFYLGQYLWGVIYLALAATPLAQIVWIACALEGVWYLTQSDESFTTRFPTAGAALSAVSELTKTGPGTQPIGKLTHRSAVEDTTQAASQVATALRELDRLRQDGLMTEYEFEQKRRKLLEQIG